MRAANSAIPCRTPTVRRSTTLDLVVAAVVGDGEAETGPLATAWHSNKFLNPVTDGAVLPILHLNGYKIANPTVLARIDADELNSLLVGYGYKPYLVEGDDPEVMHQRMAATLDAVFDDIRTIQTEARQGRADGRAQGRINDRPRWPMIILKTPKGWTGPKEVDGLKTEGFWRSHQVPFAEMATKPAHVKLLEQWMKSYRPDELFDDAGVLKPEIAALAPAGIRRMSANPHANGGLLMRELELPEITDYAVTVATPGGHDAEATAVMAGYCAMSCAPARRCGTFDCSARTRRHPTAYRTCSRRPTVRGTRRRCRTTIISRRTVG